MNPTFFSTPKEFREWLEVHHKTKDELIVGFYKVKSNKPSITWSESVDQALCYGWIDGIRRSIDNESYSIRFTPRRSTSIWSAINIKKVKELSKAGLMTPAGISIFKQRKDPNSKGYSYENINVPLDADYERQFKINSKAWEFFNNQAPYYQKATKNWIMSAKQEKTRLSRLEKTIQASELEKRLK